MLHFFNVYLTIYIAAESSEGVDQCSWYFTIFIIDLMPGLLFIFFFSFLFDLLFSKCGCYSMKSGNYVYDNNGELGIKYCVYFLQLLTWVMVVILSKVFTLLIQYFVFDYLKFFSSIALKIFNFNNVRKNNLKGFEIVFCYDYFPFACECNQLLAFR